MKYPVLLLAMLIPIMAQDNQEQNEQAASPAVDNLPSARPQGPQEAAMEKLFSTMGQAGFTTAHEQAKRAGIHPQTLLEARFLHLIDMGDNAGLAAMAPELIKNRDNFDSENSEIFSVKEDWLAIIHYTQALAALEQGDKKGFKNHITEAFWLSPRQGQAFAPHIDKLRLQEAMKSIILDPDLPIQAQQDAKTTKLGKLMKGHKATILHFWSPMSQEVQINMADFVLTTKSCKQQNIAVLSILVGDYPGILQDAETMRKEDAAGAECMWLLDPNRSPLSNLLRVRDIPTMVIVSPEGKILFNGHPSDINFWQTILTVSPEFKRPNSIK